MRLTALEFVIITLATYRITRLVIADVITEPIRMRTVYRLHKSSKWRELFSCPWCISIWLGFAVTALVWWQPVVITWLALPFAISTLVGLIEKHE